MHARLTPATARCTHVGGERLTASTAFTGMIAVPSSLRPPIRFPSIRQRTGMLPSEYWQPADVRALRRIVPRAVRHGVSAQLARLRAARLERDLATVAAGSDTIVAGPWLGEVGFELLYWVPFLAWFADRFRVAPERLLVVSRGGTAAWYRPFAANYREIFDYLTPEEFRKRHDERLVAQREQKQTDRQ